MQARLTLARKDGQDGLPFAYVSFITHLHRVRRLPRGSTTTYSKKIQHNLRLQYRYIIAPYYAVQCFAKKNATNFWRL